MKRIRCPVHHDIQVDEEFLPLLDSPPVQRLRHISQLGMANLVYPGANHTRFEHSMGVFHLAGLCARSLELSRDDGKALRAAALLHDAGHGPFSHLSEELFGVERPLTGVSVPVSHEERTCEIVGKEMAGSLEHAGIEPARVIDILRGKQTFSVIVSADLDVDRMDYLVRDAHYTGVNAGVDPGRLSSKFRLYGDNRIALAESGLASAESLLLARYLMYSTIYFHHAVRCAERMLMRAIALELSGDDNPGTNAFFAMDDCSVTHLLSETRNRECRALVKGLRERRLHKRVLEVRYSHIRDHERLGELTGSGRLWELEREIETDAGLPQFSLLIDAPSPPAGDPTRTPILLDNGDVSPLHSLSIMVDGLQRAQLDHWRLRIFAPPGYRDDRKLKERASSALFSLVEIESDERQRLQTEQKRIPGY